MLYERDQNSLHSDGPGDTLTGHPAGLLYNFLFIQRCRDTAATVTAQTVDK